MQDAPNLDAWKGALVEQNLPLTIIAVAPLDTHFGFLPMRLENRDTGLHFLIEDYADLAEHFLSLRDISIEKPVVYSLSFGSDSNEGAVVLYSAFALTVEFNGIAFDPQRGAVVPPDALLETAKLFHEMGANQ